MRRAESRARFHPLLVWAVAGAIALRTQAQAVGLLRASLIEQAQIHGFGIRRGQGKVDAVCLQGGTQGLRVAGEELTGE